MKDSKEGFTLIELLVVIAVIALLASLLIPSLTRMLEVGKRIRAAHNMRMLTTGWAMYATDHDGLMLGAETGGGTRPTNQNFPGAPNWIGSGNTISAIKNGGLWPYVQDLDAYNDPTSILPYYASFSVNGCLNGTSYRFTSWPMPMTWHYDKVEDPSGTFVFIPDYDNRGSILGSFVIDPPNWNWVDRVCGNYSGGDNLSFADGHVEFRRWIDPDTLSGTGYNHFVRDPNSEDMLWLGTAYFPTSNWP